MDDIAWAGCTSCGRRTTSTCPSHHECATCSYCISKGIGCKECQRRERTIALALIAAVALIAWFLFWLTGGRDIQ